ncbi:DUF6153 family protein [Streptomyces sp. CA-210063]|uniref:DUF6153 family protein n=1 Tax=Streptomyces sp. CA-210063 TaxID=2801029 RepID=UPI00214AAF65|nr:DUF6153 family protein [Streptomyces sp. CA-210063]UUU32321.1 DUF6153 family protein [Streptomyces sp. CA-210063]
MTRLGQRKRPRPRSFGLLVCALLLGLLGMHGLGPVPALHEPVGHDRPTATSHAGVVVSMPGECGHDAGGGSGHVHHADPTCASASVAGAPAVVPVLVPDVVSSAEPTDVRTPSAGSGPDGGRAPPSLSELQLLRI